jgi:uncharacterized protein (TIGR00255 family)
MIQSMTGFGSATNDSFTVEIRSLNHRYLDISIKMPPYMSQYEIPLRNILKGKFQRGRLDVSITIKSDKGTQLKVNREIANNIYTALMDLQRDLLIPGEISIETIAGYREILMEDEPVCDMNDLYAAFHEAASNIQGMRIQEGKLLLKDLLARIALLNDMSTQIKPLASGEVAKWREKFTERLRFILGPEVIDNNRILQEAAIMAEKLDISEELSRIESHIIQFQNILSGDTAIGKKLDFLLQEIGREVNTLAYKSCDYAISQLVVDMKTEIEKVREQVQNIQ